MPLGTFFRSVDRTTDIIRFCRMPTAWEDLFPATILAHEVRHGRQKEEKTPVEFQEQSRNSKQNPYENDLEKEVISTTEQDAARKHGDISVNQTTRENHQGQLIEISTPLPDGKIMEDYRISIINQLR